MLTKVCVTVFLASLLFLSPGFAGEELEFDPSNARIDGSIKYTVLGVYAAHFERFSGRIGFDPGTRAIVSVDLEIDPASIVSNCAWCDKIVRSDQLLAVDKYPRIEFKSGGIIKEKEGYSVIGTLNLHGIKKDVRFTFKDRIIASADDHRKERRISGEWVIPRKEYGITWNKLLDQGGVLVGNHITVRWQIIEALQGSKEAV